MHSVRYRLSVRCPRDPDRELRKAGPAPHSELHVRTSAEGEQTRGRSWQAPVPPRRPVPVRALDERHGSEAPRAKPTAFTSACRNPDPSLGKDFSAFRLKLAMGRNQSLSQHEREIVAGQTLWPGTRTKGSLQNLLQLEKEMKPAVLFRKPTLKGCIEAIPVLFHCDNRLRGKENN